MANFIDPYNPIFYAQEALMQLERALGMANAVYRGYEEERRSRNEGETIQIRRPGTFSVQTMGTGTVQDVRTEYVQLTLNQAKEVKFGLTDKELAFTGQKIIDDHIQPAAYALANDVDNSLADLAQYIPWAANAGSTIDYSAITQPRKLLRKNAGRVLDDGNVFYAIDEELEAAFLENGYFSDVSKTGDDAGLIRGALGMRAGIQPFVNQNLPEHTGGTVVTGSDQAGALTADADAGDSEIAVGSFAAGETLKKGDVLVIAGNTQKYAVTEDVTLAGGAGTVKVWPKLVQDYSSADVVTVEADSASVHAGSFYTNLLFHRNAFALAMAPLPEIGDGAGAKMAVITDPQTNLSIRSRLAYDDTNAKVIVTLDILYGVLCLDPNLAVIYRRDK